MTVTKLFGVDDSTVSEANFEAVFGSLHEGPFAGIDNECEVVASDPAAKTVEVKTGTFITGGVFGRVSTQHLLSISDNASGNPRIDRVVLRRDNANDTVTTIVLEGTPDASPTPPSISQSGDTYEISLAQIAVADSFSSITASEITDERHDYSVCGFATGHGRRGIEILDRDVETVNIVDSAVEASLYSHEIPAGALGATGGARLSMGGGYLNNSGGAQTLQIKVKLGATTVLTSNLFSIPLSNQARAWTLDVWFLNNGASSQRMHAKFLMSFPDSDNFFIGRTDLATSGGVLGVGSNNSAEDTSAARTIDVTAKHGNAHASLNLSKYTALLELIPAV